MAHGLGQWDHSLGHELKSSLGEKWIMFPWLPASLCEITLVTSAMRWMSEMSRYLHGRGTSPTMGPHHWHSYWGSQGDSLDTELSSVPLWAGLLSRIGLRHIGRVVRGKFALPQSCHPCSVTKWRTSISGTVNPAPFTRIQFTFIYFQRIQIIFYSVFSTL